MKNILKYSLLSVLGLVLAACTSHEELDTNQLSGDVAFAGMAPNPVMRGAVLQIYGRNLSSVKEVQFTGDVTVSEFTDIKKGSKLDTLYVTVPTVGPEVGPVTIVTDNGTKASSFADLEYTEPIEFDSFTPATVLSRDVITIKGEYLYNVKSITFIGDVIVNEFVSQSRNELKVVVPANALSGKIIVSDVDKINDQTTIPNDIYSPTDLTVGQPTVTKADTTTYKSGDLITVSGGHLDMIQKIDLTGAAEVEFTVAEDFNSLSFNLPASATDGNIVLTSFAGDTFDGGYIESKSVSALTISSNAEDGRYKAGTDVTISGEDLDLVTKVDFNNGEASWYLSDGNIIATIPATAKDGGVTVTLASGKQAYTDAIEVVKPVITAIDKTAAVAGNDVVAVAGTDLDLVTAVTIGDKENSFIDCSFTYADDTVKVSIPEQAYTGVLTLTPASGYAVETEAITISYSMALAITFDAPSFQLGKPITLTGSKLLQIESISIKGKKVVSYNLRADDAMSFELPEGIGPGVYRLYITLIDGSTLSWPVPFAITAPYTETFFFEGNEDLGSWSSQPYIGAEGVLTELGAVAGDQIRIYYTPYADWWQFQIIEGHWGGLTFPELGGGYTVAANNQDAGAAYFTFELTEDKLAALTSVQGWGGTFVMQGENVKITGVSLIHFGATEKVVWEDTPVDLGSWSLNWEVKPGTMFVDAGLVSGMNLHIYVTNTADWWQVQFFDGHWGAMDMGLGNGNNINPNVLPITDGRLTIPVTDDMAEKLTTLTDWGMAFVIQGENIIVNKISIE